MRAEELLLVLGIFSRKTWELWLRHAFLPATANSKTFNHLYLKIDDASIFLQNLTWICFVLTQFLDWGSGLLFDAVFCGLFWLNFDSVLNSVWVCFGAILVKILIRFILSFELCLCLDFVLTQLWLDIVSILTQYQLSSNSVSTRGYCQFSHSIYFDSIWNKFQRLFQSISISA